MFPFKPHLVPAPKSNVVQFPVVKRPTPPRQNDIVIFNSDRVWANSEKMNWVSYEDMLKDILIDIKMGRVSPAGLLVVLVDEHASINALTCYSSGLFKEEIKAICYDLLDSST
jgi:hypothetical protein